MGYLWRIPLALFGLLLVRGLVFPRGWGRRTLLVVLLAVLGLELTIPLITYGRTGLVIGIIGALVVLMPYRQLAVRFLKGRTRAGLRMLAERWGTAIQEDPETGLWQVVREVNGRKAWVGNVLTHMRSIHPGVKKSQERYMLAFAIELMGEPPFQCSLMIGWDKPRYFEREWRSTHVMVGDHLSLGTGDLLADDAKGRATGGKADDFTPYTGLTGAGSIDLHAVGTNPKEFSRVFNDELLKKFFALASQTHPFELNVTPSSVNVYTTYCDSEAQRANIEFLEELTARLEPSARNSNR